MSQIEMGFKARSPPRGPRVYTVSQIVRGADRVLEQRMSNLWVEGEVGSLKLAAGGHAFFTLKDDRSVLPVAMFRSAVERLRFRLENGQTLRVLGRVGVYAAQGRFQLYADRAEPAGLGALMLELEQRKAKLAALGLFDPDRKRPLPPWPKTVGVVTSAHGAAIHDIVEVAHRRCPTRIVVAPAVVQGPDAPFSLRRALTRLGARSDIDVIIIGRGGGSMEDLMAFNDEGLAHAIAQCPIPVVAAVGHEVDVTIAGLVADLRAATPSHAAELVVPDRVAAIRRGQELLGRAARTMRRRLIDERSRLEQSHGRVAAAGRSLAADPRTALMRLQARLQHEHPRARIDRSRRRLHDLQTRLFARGLALPSPSRQSLRTLQTRLREAGRALPESARIRLARAAGALQALSPLRVLERGYAVATVADGRALTDARDAPTGTNLRIRLWRGTLQAEVTASDDEFPSDE